MTDFYSQNRCVCSTRSHGPLLCAFCLSFHFKSQAEFLGKISVKAMIIGLWIAMRVNNSSFLLVRTSTLEYKRVHFLGFCASLRLIFTERQFPSTLSFLSSFLLSSCLSSTTLSFLIVHFLSCCVRLLSLSSSLRALPCSL